MQGLVIKLLIGKGSIARASGPLANGQLLMDPNMIAEAIGRHFGVQVRPLDRPICKKPYPDWVDKIPLS